MPAASAMFDPEVVEELRRQFQAADRDGDGEIDAGEACQFFAQSCSPGASAEEIRSTAENLRNQMDGDRSGTISFDEYCFRFGRKLQMERNRQRRAGSAAGGAPAGSAPPPAAGPAAAPAAAAGTAPAAPAAAARTAPAAPAESEAEARLRRERERLQQEREALEREREELRISREREAVRREREELRREAEGAGQGAGQAAGAAPAPSPGARVVIQGLQGAPELNGRSATVVRFDEASARYVVALDGGEQKSLRAENLQAQGSTAFADFAERAKRGLREACAQAQVWLAGYETWQIALGVLAMALVVGAYLQNSARYGSGPRSSRPPPAGRDYAEDRHGDHGGGGGGLLEMLLPGGGNLQFYLVVGGLAYACWKGIIPVHKMSFFQLYMLWNMVEPFLMGQMGGRGRSSRRRYF